MRPSCEPGRGNPARSTRCRRFSASKMTKPAMTVACRAAKASTNRATAFFTVAATGFGITDNMYRPYPAGSCPGTWKPLAAPKCQEEPPLWLMHHPRDAGSPHTAGRPITQPGGQHTAAFLGGIMSVQNPTTPAPGTPAPAPKTTAGKGLGIAALVVAIVALLLCWVPIINNFAAFLGFVALVLGVISLVIAAKRNGSKGLGIASTVISVVAIVLVFVTQ